MEKSVFFVTSSIESIPFDAYDTWRESICTISKNQNVRNVRKVMLNDTGLGANLRDSMISRTRPLARSSSTPNELVSHAGSGGWNTCPPTQRVVSLKTRGKDKPGVNICSTPFNRLSPLSSFRPMNAPTPPSKRTPPTSGSSKLDDDDDDDDPLVSWILKNATIRRWMRCKFIRAYVDTRERWSGRRDKVKRERGKETGCIDVQGHVCRVALRNAST